MLGMEKSSSKLSMTNITTSTSKYVLCGCGKKIGKEKLAQLIIVIAYIGVAAPSP